MGEGDRDDSGESLGASDRRAMVRRRYGSVARSGSSCCGPEGDGSCCSGGSSLKLGYAPEELEAVKPGADLGLGCGNPGAIADLEIGETVLDLGSGGGFDCFLAAEAVGEDGRVIGVDMTPAMLDRARENRRRNGVSNVEFRLGEIEHLPVADESIDVVISNCVVNLSPEKDRVFEEVWRVLRPGGRMAISDVVRTAPFPASIENDPEALASCVAGAATEEELTEHLESTGFEEISIEPDGSSASYISEWDDGIDLSERLISASITARKSIATDSFEA